MSHALQAMIANMVQTNRLKYADGALALVLGILWGCRQFTLSSSYNVMSRCNLVIMRWLSLVLLVSVVLFGTIYVIVCLSLTRDDFAAPVTTSVVVGQLVAWALETRTQSKPDDWLHMIQYMRTVTRYRIGRWEESGQNEDIFKEVKGSNCLTNPEIRKRSTWETYKAGNLYYIRSWDNMDRHYNGNIKPCKKAIECKDRLAAAVACASMALSWFKVSRILLDDLFTDVNNMKNLSGSIKRCSKSWRVSYMEDMLRYNDHDASDVDKVLELAVCWLEKPTDMMSKFKGYESSLLNKWRARFAVPELAVC